MTLPRVLALTGPTGAGKTALGVALARRFDAEIINADSRQVFRSLDIGSAKPSMGERGGVPHHLFDVVDPDQDFDVARYRQLALASIGDIHARGRRALLVGGTGLYLKVVRGGLFAGPARNPELRARLNEEEDREAGTLHRRLAQVDPAAAARLHPNDRLRLIRALEVFETTQRPISEWQAQHNFGNRELEMMSIAIEIPRPELYRRIEARCQTMLRAGFVDEVRQLLAAGYDPASAALQSVGYREIGQYLLGHCKLEEAESAMAQATRRLAKRQTTWFRGDPETRWCPPDEDQICELATRWWCQT